MPRDAAREAKVDFGPAYYFISSTYLVPAGSKIQSIDEVNRPGVRIVAIWPPPPAKQTAGWDFPRRN